MKEFLIYMLKANLALAVFYIGYRLLFVRDTFFGARRVYLLSAIAFSFIYPAIHIPEWISQQQTMQVVVAQYTQLPDFVVTSPKTSALTMTNVAVIIYFTVAAVLLLYMLMQLVSLVVIKHKSKIAIVQNTTIRVLNTANAPFSFFGMIFLNPDLYSENEIGEILTHEQTHVKQWHSIDTVLGQLLTVVCWFNPFAWLLRSEIHQNVEFLADSKVLKRGHEAHDYQMHLLQLSTSAITMNYKVTNHFNISSLKKRIIMMNKQKTSKTNLWKYLMAVPVAIVLVIASNVQTLSASVNNLQNSFSTEKITNDDSDHVYRVVERMPEFPGGTEALMGYLSKNVKYPESAKKNSVQGKVIIQFIVNKKGQVVSPKITKSVSPELDAEALRVIRAMPQWEPATQHGKTVDCMYTISIAFKLSHEQDSEKVFNVVEKMPEFPGGMPALMKFLSENIKYPEAAKQNNIQGKVICQFIVDKNGNVVNPKILKSVNADLDSEAIRVINLMPAWTPGEQKGTKVNCKYSIPINFKLDNHSDSVANNSMPKNIIYIVDDEVVSANYLKDLAPDKIKAIEVVKKKEALQPYIAKYGEKAANGIILVTTK